MSELTPCNRCTLDGMERRAKDRGAKVLIEVVNDPRDEMFGWTVVRFSDRDEPSAWFMELTEECAC